MVVAVTTAAQAGRAELEAAVAAPATAAAVAVAEEMPATAELISAAVASSTRRFWEKMQPSTSSSVSQEFPLPVVSLV